MENLQTKFCSIPIRPKSVRVPFHFSRTPPLRTLGQSDKEYKKYHCVNSLAKLYCPLELVFKKDFINNF